MTVTIGSRVQSVVWGVLKCGTVTRVGHGPRPIVFLRWDGNSGEAWMHLESLQPEGFGDNLTVSVPSSL